jgi:hypothetical protein
MDKAQIKRCLDELNERLRSSGVMGEICLYGGAVMCVVYDARPATRDVDAVFKPTREIREAIKRIAEANGLREDWLNDAVKGYVVPHRQRILFNLSNLKVYVPEPDYLLAMKVLAARVEATDKMDIQFLIKLLGINTPDEVFSILEKYYSREQIRPATQFFVEEIFES